MGIHNSQTQYYIGLLSEQILDLADIVTSESDSQEPDPKRCEARYVQARKDIDKVSSRVHTEGMSFLTKQLPLLAKAFDKALLGEQPFASIGWCKSPGTMLPKFLGWAFERVLRPDGFVQDEPSVRAMSGLRQVLYSMYKLDLPRKAETDGKVITDFTRVDSQLGGEHRPASALGSEVIREAAAILAAVFGDFDPSAIIPRHGPGAVATGERGHKKHAFKRLYTPLQALYPFDAYFCVSQTHVCDHYRQFEDLRELEQATAKVILVPKDSRGPRLISAEPLEIQWIQQGIGQKMISHLECHRLTKGHVNFTCQEINRSLALKGSLTQEWVTLDMKEASDRVSLDLVKGLFPEPLLSSLLAARSALTKLPDGTIVPLKKYAPMGSALCFPVESVVFWALSVAILTLTGLPRREARKSVYVYGDDLIIRSKVYAPIMQILPLFSLLFNEGKCCTTGFFRESCGCDAFKGVDITPTKFRRAWPSSRFVPDLVSWVDYSNQLWDAGFSRSALYIQEKVERKVPFPYRDKTVPSTPLAVDPLTRPFWVNQYPEAEVEHRLQFGVPSPSFMPIERQVFSIARPAQRRFNKSLCREEVYAPIVASHSYEWEGNDWSHLLKWFTNHPSAEGHVSSMDYTVPHRTTLKKRWVPAE